MTNSDTKLIREKHRYFINITYILWANNISWTWSNITFSEFINDRYLRFDIEDVIKSEFQEFKKKRYAIIKSFKNKKLKLKIKAYMTILKRHFCFDISNIIVQYLI